MHRGGDGRVDRDDHVLPDAFGDERGERRHQQSDRAQRLVQGGEGGRVAAPEPAAAAAHVPVREVIDEAADRSARRGGVVGVQPLPHRADGALEARDRPAVEVGARLDAELLGRVIEPVHVRVQHIEVVGVPEHVQEFANALAHRLDGEAIARPRLL